MGELPLGGRDRTPLLILSNGSLNFVSYTYFDDPWHLWTNLALFLVLIDIFSEKNQAMKDSMSENACRLCGVEKLTFEPPPIYCSPCGARIKRNNMYYSMGAGDTRHYFCIACYNEARGDTIVVDGTVIPKHRLEKKKNDEETEEWVCKCS